jgi:PKD repeat protein
MARLKVSMTFAIAVALGLAACTVHKQDTPSLTGPSELGTSVTIQVSPDVLTQDGASQSIVTITARDSNGQPLRSLSLRADITVDGKITDAMGSLSARNLVTDSNGIATVVFTAPQAPAVAVDFGTTVTISVTPAGTNAGNATPRTASIRLIPEGVVGPPASPLRPDFVPPSAILGDAAVFSAIVVDASGANALNQVASFVWDFGDGHTASGQTVTHTFANAGSFPVTLTITDTLARTATTRHTLTVGQGTLPTAVIVTSPASPVIGQAINFNASTSVPAPGRSIRSYGWNFGDGSTGGGAQIAHAYTIAGTYTVILTVTDDVGRVATATQTITVGTGNPTADFTFNPSAPRSGQQVTFDASGTQAAPGRTIVSYSWSFGNGLSGTGQTVTTTFTTGATPTTFNVLLTVTDSAGKTSSTTKPITINP